MSLPRVVAVQKSARHAFSKERHERIVLLAGLGVEGDAHCGATVQHVYDRKKGPDRVNLRQVHLIQTELLDELSALGFSVRPGELGENISTRGLDVLSLPTGTELRIGPEAVIEVTGLRTPCFQIERFQKGLQAHVGGRSPGGGDVSKTGVMGIVLRGGTVSPGDVIVVNLPTGEHRPLIPV
jgi:MOSC domain-containing protein YiiM